LRRVNVSFGLKTGGVDRDERVEKPIRSLRKVGSPYLAVCAFILIFVGFALRLYRIAYQSVWWDEAYSLHMAREGMAVMLGLPGGATQVHWDQPPLYYLLLNLWVGLVGDSEFGLRSLSSVLGVLLLPVVYRVAGRLFDRRTGLAALAVAAFSPVYIVYSQETRVYAVLPLCYLLSIYLFHRLMEAGEDAPLRLWVALAVVEALSLYLHYFTALGIVYLNLLFLAIALLSRWRGSRYGRPRDGMRPRDGGWEQEGRAGDGMRPRDGGWEQEAGGGWEQEAGKGWGQRAGSLRRWIGSQVLAALLFAPWAWNMARHWDYFRSRGSIRESWVVPPGALPFAWRIWGFFIGGNEAAVQGLSLLSAGVTILAAVCGLALLLAVLIGGLGASVPRLGVFDRFASRGSPGLAAEEPHLATRLERRRSRRLWLTLVHGLGPLALCFAAWQFWPDAHPRYTLAYSIPLFLVMGRLLALSFAQRAQPLSHPLTPILFRSVGALLACALILTCTTGLWAHYFDERFHKDEVRAVAAYLEEVTTAEDVILVGPGDYSLQYYYDGPATVSMARDEPRADKVRHLQEITLDKSRFFLVDWDPSKADLHGLRPFLLERAGQLTAWRDFRGLDVRVYALHEDVGTLPQLRQLEPGARFGPLLLTGITYEPTVTSDNAVAVALGWRLVEPAERAYKVVVLLVDGAGRRISSADVMILDEAGRQTYAWAETASTVNYYVVPVPVGTPPLPHRLAVGVYDAETLERPASSWVDTSGRWARWRCCRGSSSTAIPTGRGPAWIGRRRRTTRRRRASFWSGSPFPPGPYCPARR
jgi:hypothetical protein